MKNKESKEKIEVTNLNKGFKTKKRYGQNFLSDHFIVSKIVELANIDKDTNVIEIGPGMGAMTTELIKYAKKVVAFEIDEEVVPILKDNLKKYDNYEIINKDILKIEPSFINSIDGKVISVSNLPYYITSPIIDLYLRKMVNVTKAVFMVQKEVADRICAPVGTKDYNAFSILVQYYARCKKILSVPRSCFTPSPNVDSAVIELIKYERAKKAHNDEFFTLLVESSFKERRKMLINNLSSSFNISKEKIKEILNSLNIREDARAETLSIDEFIKLSDIMEELV